MVSGWGACPTCDLAPVSKNGRDRRRQQAYRCRRGGRCFTAPPGTAFSGYLFPPDMIALAVRYSLR
jgi:transposase-like protein